MAEADVKHLGYVQEAKMLGIYLAFPLMHVWPLPHAALIRMRSEMVMLSSLACLSSEGCTLTTEPHTSSILLSVEVCNNNNRQHRGGE